MIGPPLNMNQFSMKNNKKLRIFTIPQDVHAQCISWDCDINQESCSILPKYIEINSSQTENQLLLEYQGGTVLAEKIKQLKAQKECFTEKELTRILHCLMIGLYHLHKKNLLGRCYNTRNIILRDDGSIVFTKCGFAHALIDMDEILQLPPEIVYQKQYDHRIDQWLLGVILYQCILQKPVSKFQSDQLKEYQEFLYKNQQEGNTFPDIVENRLIDLFSITQMLLKFDPEDRLSYEQLLNLDAFKDLDKKWRIEMITFYEQKFPLQQSIIKEKIKIRESKWFGKTKIDYRSKSIQIKREKKVFRRFSEFPLNKVKLIFMFSEQITIQNKEKFLMLNLGLYCLNLYDQLRIELEKHFPQAHLFGFYISQIIVIKIHDLIQKITNNLSPSSEIQRCIKALKNKQTLEKECNIKTFQKKKKIHLLTQTIPECFHNMKQLKEFKNIDNGTKFNFCFSEYFENILSLKFIWQKPLKQVAYFNGVEKIDDVNQIQSFLELAPSFYKKRLMDDVLKIIQNQ